MQLALSVNIDQVASSISVWVILVATHLQIYAWLSSQGLVLDFEQLQ